MILKIYLLISFCIESREFLRQISNNPWKWKFFRYLVFNRLKDRAWSQNFSIKYILIFHRRKEKNIIDYWRIYSLTSGVLNVWTWQVEEAFWDRRSEWNKIRKRNFIVSYWSCLSFKLPSTCEYFELGQQRTRYM